jgi:hypothetical protein
MEKKEYSTPKMLEHGDVKKITLGGGTTSTVLDGDYITVGGATWYGVVPDPS